MTNEQIGRYSNGALDAVLGVKIPVLNGQGFIRVIDYMGGDESIVQAARISYGAGTKTVREDRGLIRYLMRHRHTTPFEMCELKLHVRCPMDVWRQWIRHRTASVNEYSTRYSEAIDDFSTTLPDGWRKQSKANKQGGDEFLPDNDGGRAMTAVEAGFLERARQVYRQRLELGIAREQARKDLPLSTFTESYWKIDLHNLLHFLSLRMDSHAQLEIREYANRIGEVVAQWVPLTWEAFVDYRLNSINLSASEVNSLFIGRFDDSLSDRERTELHSKLVRLGFEVTDNGEFIND